ncbi:MAG: MFS transporter [Candidatus Bathyarchaeia archaeon]
MPDKMLDREVIGYEKAALMVTALGSFLTAFMGSSINIALPSIGKEFLMNAVLLSWTAVSFLLAAAMFLVPIGKIADVYGRKKIFTLGVLSFTFSSFLSAISVSAISLIVFRFFQGIGAAMMYGTSVAILASVFPIGKRGGALGVNVASVYLGLSSGPFLGGFLTQNYGWRSIFLLNVVLGLMIVPLIVWRLKGEWAEVKGEKFDYVGSIIYGLSLLEIMYGFSKLPEMSGIWLALIGILGILLFVVWEVRTKTPILDIDLFRNNTIFALSNLAAFINYSATFAVTFLLSLYLQYIKGFDPQTAGLVLMAQPVMMTILSPFTGRLSDRIEPRVIASLGMTFTTLGLFLFIFLDKKTSLDLILTSLIFLGIGLALFSSPNTNAIMSSIEKKFYGVASGTLGTMRLVGQMLSMGIVMLIFAVYMGKSQITPENYSLFLMSVKNSFIIFTILCFLGIFASFARGKFKNSEIYLV